MVSRAHLGQPILTGLQVAVRDVLLYVRVRGGATASSIACDREDVLRRAAESVRDLGPLIARNAAGRVRRNRWQSLAATLLLLLSAACVRTPDTQVAERWITLSPGVPIDMAFSTEDGALAGVAFRASPDAVSSAIDLRIDVPVRADFAFLEAGGGFEPHTPVVRLAPAGVRLGGAVRLVLPWVGLDDDVAEAQVRVLRTDGADAVSLGLWEAITDVTVLPDRIEVGVDRTGVYWAGHWRADVFGQPITTVLDPCLESVSGLESCSASDQCQVSGCFAEVCAAAPVETACRPSDAVTARRDCACRCASQLCQWIR
ncbi:MAG: hypothetical protein D6761_01040 [Candidatus Dadabacteria bacterium]|nr:MAG: hypothetical protein D6761_01040 [Candidatus Dadabacteria bacterium]